MTKGVRVDVLVHDMMWRFGLVVTALMTSTKLLYVERG